MTDENKEIVEEAQIEQQQQIVENVVQTAPKEQPKDDSSENWKQANEILRLQKQRIQELEAREADRLNQVQQRPSSDEPDELDSLDPEDYITAGKAKEMAKKLATKVAEDTARKAVQEYAQQQAVTLDESRMRAKYDDYDYVVENFAIPAIKNDPALAHKIQQSKNPAETAYKLGKLSDGYSESVEKQEVSPKAEKIMKNASRPVSSAAASTPLKTQAESFSKMSKADIWEQSQKYAKGA